MVGRRNLCQLIMFLSNGLFSCLGEHSNCNLLQSSILINEKFYWSPLIAVDNLYF